MATDRLMVPGLRHQCSRTTDADFMALIDQCGGWPLGYKYVGFEHTEERAAGFCNSPQNSGWWTVVASADDYHLWKLSPDALQRIADAAVSAVRLPKVNAASIHIKNFMGHNAARSAS